MLVELRLRGLGAIEAARLELGPGFTAVTGETGAGKTMLLTGLALLLGGRGDAGLVRAGHSRAEIEGRFRLPPGGLADRVTELGGELDDGELIVTRTVGADGRSRASLGGRSVPVATLASLADDLVTVHGQAGQRGLLRPAVQREVLDRFSGEPVLEPLRAYRTAFEELSGIRARLREVSARRRERALEAEALRQGLRDVDEVAPQPGEDAVLRAEVARLGHADALRFAAAAAHQALHSDADPAITPSDAQGLLGAARQALAAMQGHDPDLDALATRLNELSYQAVELATDLAVYLDRVDTDPGRLASLQDRLARLTSLTRRYGADIDAVLGWAAAARQRLAELDDDGRVAELRARHDTVLGELTAAAGVVSTGRREAAERLDGAVTAELQGLGMPNARLVTVSRRREDPNGLRIGETRVAFGPSGVDDVELQLVPHTGAGPRPLHRGASGGELSRIMLALEIVLAGADAVPSFVFDEVDAGVGGRAAVEVGRRLAGLARHAQVLVVTHLPQVAAFADRHVVVTKTEAGLVAESGIDLVDGESRLRELSRMLAGLEDSDLARGHAQELLATAAAVKTAAG